MKTYNLTPYTELSNELIEAMVIHPTVDGLRRAGSKAAKMLRVKGTSKIPTLYYIKATRNPDIEDWTVHALVIDVNRFILMNSVTPGPGPTPPTPGTDVSSTFRWIDPIGKGSIWVDPVYEGEKNEHLIFKSSEIKYYEAGEVDPEAGNFIGLEIAADAGMLERFGETAIVTIESSISEPVQMTAAEAFAQDNKLISIVKAVLGAEYRYNIKWHGPTDEGEAFEESFVAMIYGEAQGAETCWLEPAPEPVIPVETPEQFIEDLANGGNLELEADIELAESVEVAANTVINLNGHNLSFTNNGYGISVDEGVELSIEGEGDVTVAGRFLSNGGKTEIDITGTIETETDVLIANRDGSELTIYNGTFKSRESTVLTSCKNSVVNIEGGEFYASDNGCIMDNGVAGRDGNVINVYGGKFNASIISAGYIAVGMYIANDNTVNLYGGEFNVTGGCGICARAGHVNILGDVLFNTTGDAIGKVGDSKVVVPCSALVFDIRANYPGLKENSGIEVKDGYYQSEVDAVSVVCPDGEPDNSRIKLAGGHYSNDVSDFVEEGYACEVDPEGGYKVVATA